MRERFTARERVTRPEHALLPGFVNAHTRGALRLLRGLPVQGPLTRWLHDTLRPSEARFAGPDFAREGAKLAVAEMLQSGITAFADRFLFPEETARVACAARVRAAIGLPVSDGASAWADGATGHLAKAERLWDEYQSDAWVSLHFAPGPFAEVSDETLARVRRIADELDARLAMEVQTTAAEVQQSLAQFGCRPLERLQRLGLLRPGFAGIHLNRLDAEDLDRVAATGISVIACTQSDLRLGSGQCPIRQCANRGVPLGLGTGDPVSAGALDILAEARAAALIANGQPDGAQPLPAEEILHMATLGGAQALGIGHLVGSIEPDKAADLVCLDLGALACRPAARPADSILFAATRSQISDVWTSGRAAVSAGRLLAFDERELADLAEQWSLRTGIVGAT